MDYKEPAMKVFLSWSGARSRAAAQFLRQWLPDVIQSIEPWMSAEDIDAGARWNSELTNKLAETRCGIICLTQDNQQAPWILFEAGALSKTIEKTYVIPYLIDLAPSDILRGPLTQFQAKGANKSETFQLLCTLNGAMDNPLTDAQLQRGFDRCWNELETLLKDLPAPTSHQEKRSEDDKLTEVLEIVRTLARAVTDDITPRLENLPHHSSTRTRATLSLTDETKAKILWALHKKSPSIFSELQPLFDPLHSGLVQMAITEMKKYDRLVTFNEPLNDDSWISLVRD
jgi:hypothetical protein